MKKHCLTCALLGGLLACASVQADGLTNLVNLPIPDANPNGLYSTIDVSGLSGRISDLTVYLETTGTWNGDLYAYLTSDHGGFSILLNRPGKTLSNPVGYGDGGFSLQLNDHASGDIHLYGGNLGQPVSGLWQPDGRNTDPQLALDTDPRNAMLQSFIGLDPNGTWTLFIADLATDYENQLVRWGLDLQIQAVPEPSPTMLALVAVTWITWLRRRR